MGTQSKYLSEHGTLLGGERQPLPSRIGPGNQRKGGGRLDTCPWQLKLYGGARIRSESVASHSIAFSSWHKFRTLPRAVRSERQDESQGQDLPLPGLRAIMQVE